VLRISAPLCGRMKSNVGFCLVDLKESNHAGEKYRIGEEDSNQDANALPYRDLECHVTSIKMTNGNEVDFKAEAKA
jgi:hypothetical protein